MKGWVVFACLWGWAVPGPEWLPATWNGEPAKVLRHGPWVAVVSLERGRLVEFGSVEAPFNFLHAPSDREKNRWGGHRVWLGPQRLWKATWPPPEAWEHRAPVQISAEGSRLELVMGDEGEGWPRLTRAYFPAASTLVCEVRVEGGRRSGQIMQIFQVPSVVEVRLRGEVGKEIPQGALLLPEASGLERPIHRFPMPTGLTLESGSWILRNPTNRFRLGFVGGPMEWFHGTRNVVMKRVQASHDDPIWTETSDPPGILFSNPARGFHEAEQLSKTFGPGEALVFSVTLEMGAL